ncbi:MAG: SDR family oxidoreductase [Actinomycetota bacterium]|nr:SDR family oxidoreductase [Actinomycetota bacterium]
MEIKGRVVVVTGGASGIGAAMARRFASEGAERVIVCDIDGGAARSVASRIDGDAFTLDVADEGATVEVLGEVEAEYGRIDVLCLNAGIPTGGSVDATNEDWQRTWDVNVMAHVYATRHALPGMLDRGEGYILTTASAAGLLTNIGAAPYSVTKHAAVALAEWISVTYGSRGIRVSCLCPMFVSTPMLDAFSGHTDAMRDWVEGLAIDVDDVADSVIAGIREETFLILPHPAVRDYFQHKALDYDRWIAGMQSLNDQVTRAE